MADDHHDEGGISRRHALECMLWAGTGVLWAVTGGVPRSIGLLDSAAAATATGLTFLQISDSHVGFDKPANPHAIDTLKEAIDRIKAMPQKPSFMLHTGDITHLSKPAEFDNAAQLIGSAGLQVHYVPGEHDIVDEGTGKAYLERYGQNTKGAGWYSFDQGGVHFIGLVNVANLKAGGLGFLGPDQLEWLEDDVKGSERLDADRRLRPHPPVVGLSELGMGHGRCCRRARLSQALRLGDRSQRPHPPAHAEGRRQRHVPYGTVDGLPAAGARYRPLPRADAGAG